MACSDKTSVDVLTTGKLIFKKFRGSNIKNQFQLSNSKTIYQISNIKKLFTAAKRRGGAGIAVADRRARPTTELQHAAAADVPVIDPFVIICTIC